jgi:hypothetical protein
MIVEKSAKYGQELATVKNYDGFCLEELKFCVFHASILLKRIYNEENETILKITGSSFKISASYDNKMKLNLPE